jgi:hypothetical protein
LILLLLGCSPALRAQDLSPRAYLITPLRTNAVTLSTAYNDGELLLEGTVPITDATGKLDFSTLTLYHSLGFFGRSANATASLPYGLGDFSGTAFGSQTTTHRSGLLDTVVRFSVNLKGGPAMGPVEMIQWRQKLLIGASLRVVAPTGQYDPTKLINLGSNRWSFKPELGLSRRWGHWLLDGYAGVWFFTENPEFFSNNAYVSGTHAQTQKPITAIETHLSYDVRQRLWVSADANFWYGGTTSLDGVENAVTVQKNSRIGLTASFPLGRRHSVKVGYARGAYVRFGGDYRIYSLAWQYSWVHKPQQPPAARTGP